MVPKIRNLYGLAKKAGRILVAEGPAGVLRKGKRFLGKRALSSTARVEYQKWLQSHFPSPSEIETQRQKSQAFKYRPKISFITPVYNTPPPLLRKCIESVLQQSYENWEHCLVDDASTSLETRELLQHFARQDPRIRVKFREKNGHISEASNDAVSFAEGEFVALLDHDDIVWPNALFEVVSLLNQNPSADIVYSDEDKIDGSERHFAPFFKPDWSPDLSLNIMYLSHFLVVRKRLLVEVGGYNSAFNGTQDWEMTLRASERTNNILHIPRILYSWRAWEGSTALSMDSAKPYAFQSQENAIEEMRRRRNLYAAVEPGAFRGALSIKYLPKENLKVSIIVHCQSSLVTLKQTIYGITAQNDYRNFEIILVHDESLDQASLETLTRLQAAYPQVRLLKLPALSGVAEALNAGAGVAQGELLLFLNNRGRPTSSDWLGRLVGHIEREGVGAVGAKVLFSNHTIKHCGVVVGYGEDGVAQFPYYGEPNQLGLYGMIDLQRNVSSVTADCLMTKKDLFQAIQSFKSQTFPNGYYDIDYCLSLRNMGQLIVYEPKVCLMDFETSAALYSENAASPHRLLAAQKFQNKWHDYPGCDPYFNPNIVSTANFIEYLH